MTTTRRSRGRRVAVLAAALGASLAGCTVGPDFLRPEPPKADTYLPDAPAEVQRGISTIEREL